MGYTEMIIFNPKEKKPMIRRMHPDKRIEWLPLSEWGLTKSLEIVALIFEEDIDRPERGRFYKTTIKLTVDPKAPELYLKMSGRRQVIDPQTNHVRTFAVPIVKDVKSGKSTVAVFSPFLKNSDFRLSTLPHVVYVDIEATDAVKISTKQASNILEKPLGCAGVFRDFKLRERLY